MSVYTQFEKNISNKDLLSYWDFLEKCMSKDKATLKQCLKSQGIKIPVRKIYDSDMKCLLVYGTELVKLFGVGTWEIIKNTYYYTNLSGFSLKLYVLAVEILAYQHNIAGATYSAIGSRYKVDYLTTLSELQSSGIISRFLS